MPLPTTLSNLPPWAEVVATYYSGSSSIYSGFARMRTALTTLPTISSATKAATCELTITAHKLPPQSRARIFITGATGTGWTALNAAAGLVATYTGANTVTVPLDSQAYGTLGGTIVVTTYYPTTDLACWAIQATAYDSSSNATLIGWAEGSQAANKVLDNRALYAY